MHEISKADWKKFQEKVPLWQERYMEGLLQEYMEILSSPDPASKRFWELAGRIKNDRSHPGVQLSLRKSEAFWDIVSFLRMKVITMDDLDGFSRDLIDAINEILNRSWEE